VLAVRPVFHWFKVKRSAQLAENANALVAAGNLKEAAGKFRAALQLDPIGYPALHGAARLASQVGRPEALDLWEQVVKTRQATIEDRQAYAEQLMLVGRARPASAVIEALLKDAPNAKTLDLAARYSRSTGETAKALQFARLAVKATPNDNAQRFKLAELLATSTDSAERAEARKILWELSVGPYRQPAIEALAASPELSDAERKQALDLLGTISSKNLRDELLAADLKLQLHLSDPQTIYDEVIAQWNRGEVSDLVETRPVVESPSAVRTRALASPG